MRARSGGRLAGYLALIGLCVGACGGAPEGEEWTPEAAPGASTSVTPRRNNTWFARTVQRQEVPALDPVVEFPHETVWREYWFPIDNGQRANNDAVRLVDRFLALAPGMRVADLGAGGGYYTFRIAQAVGPGGRVLATDVDRRMTRKIAWEARARGVASITVMQSTSDDLGLGDDRFDVILMNDTPILAQCDAAREARIVRQVAGALDRGGRWVYFAEAPESGPVIDCEMPSESHVRELAARYFDVDGIDHIEKPAGARPWTGFALVMRRNSAPVE